ncbi:SDR family oxidoreductase [Bradyrhizobium sp. DOA9]|uniref:SDR family oxidoreductase n=1 Tax=Bradyrhizobium sp. DOA9 TaxID=1126627 RepID=UPI00046A5DA6|nr:SDR family oxidoreductase [Bradyrhizobium sp. DOA9]GAJ37966.1 hypothetical protein ytfG [Bradyrhizobium sp. DOA9]
MSETILITGAAGQLGRGVAHHLLSTRAVRPDHLLLTSRDPAKLEDFANKGVMVRPANFDDEASLVTAFQGADRALLISTNELMEAGKRLRQHKAAVAGALKAGVCHIAYTSMPKPEPGNPVLFAPDHYGTEQAIKETGLPYTIFRNGWYQENLFMVLPQVLKTGKWYSSAGEGRTAYISRGDIACAIAASLASAAKDSATYTLTGAEALTNSEIAVIASRATGRPIEVINLPDDALAEGMKAAGMPAGLVPLLISFERNARIGGLSDVTLDAEKLSGKTLQSLTAFMEANKATLLA